jgi:nucleotide-binding universal stress UspA family protein
MFDKILVPYDGSEFSAQAFPVVAELARTFGSGIFIIGVCGAVEGITRQSCDFFVNRGSEAIKKMIADKPVRLYSAVLEGNAAQQILDFARENGVDIIVASSHGRSGIKPWPLGKTVRNLLREAVPILIVRAIEKPQSNIFDRILIPLDGSETSYAVIAPLTALAERIKTTVTLFRVIEREHPVHTLGGVDSVDYLDEDLDTKEKESGEYLDKIKTRLGKVAQVKRVVRVGHPAKEIIAQASEEGITLIAMASHVHSAMETWFYGSVTQQLVNDGRFSFLLIPATGS